jgi:PhnB protein
MSAVKAIPEGYHSITPSIVCKDAARAIEFYKGVFNATEKVRMEGPGGVIMHAELLIGNSHLMLSDEIPGMANAPKDDTPNCINLFLYTEEVDAVFQRAVRAGAQMEMPLQNMFWGDRYGKLRDPFGHRWGLAQHIEDVAPEEMKRRSDEYMQKMSKAAAG